MSDLRVPLSVLDLAPVAAGSTPTDALGHSRDLIRLAEARGYRRYWVAEHHNMPGIASSSPAVLIGALAAVTERIRVGSGGVMLPNHAPLVVAEQFGTLAALYPGRIDLGIGRAPGTDPETAAALRRSTDPLSAQDFPNHLGELLRYLAPADDAPPRAVRAVPAADEAPSPWLLGSSGYSAQVAGMLGLPFAFAHHFSAPNTLPALQLYRESFRPSDTLAQPYAMVAAGVVCAEDADRARWLAGPTALSMLRLRSGRPGPLPTPAEAAAYDYTAAEREVVAAATGGHVVGDPAGVSAELADLMTRTEADELMITAMVYPAQDRLRSYELLADMAASGAISAASTH